VNVEQFTYHQLSGNKYTTHVLKAKFGHFILASTSHLPLCKYCAQIFLC